MTKLLRRAICHDCGVEEGRFHLPGCDMERCPFCGHQLITCECAYEKLGIDCSPGAWVYSHGLTDEQCREWDKLLRAKGLIPFIVYPNLCAKCGTLWPEMFSVSDEDWARYVEPNMRKEMLCEPCYRQIKTWIDDARIDGPP